MCPCPIVQGYFDRLVPALAQGCIEQVVGDKSLPCIEDNCLFLPVALGGIWPKEVEIGLADDLVWRLAEDSNTIARCRP